MHYRVIDLSTELVDGVELPIIAGSHHITPQISGFYTAHSDITIGRYGKFHPIYAVIYKDGSGTWLVGAQTDSILDTIGSGTDLDSFVDSTPANWHCYRATYDEESIQKHRRFRGITGLNKGLLTALGVENPIALSVAPVLAYALQATVPAFCCGLNPAEIELSTRQYGEELKILENIKEEEKEKSIIKL